MITEWIELKSEISMVFNDDANILKLVDYPVASQEYKACIIQIERLFVCTATFKIKLEGIILDSVNRLTIIVGDILAPTKVTTQMIGDLIYLGRNYKSDTVQLLL